MGWKKDSKHTTLRTVKKTSASTETAGYRHMTLIHKEQWAHLANRMHAYYPIRWQWYRDDKLICKVTKKQACMNVAYMLASCIIFGLQRFCESLFKSKKFNLAPFQVDKNKSNFLTFCQRGCQYDLKTHNILGSKPSLLETGK